MTREFAFVSIASLAVLVTACGVIFPLVLFWIVRGTRGAFLFERPLWARLQPGRVGSLVAAE